VNCLFEIPKVFIILGIFFLITLELSGSANELAASAPPTFSLSAQMT
jgi:hypothetical protein